MPCPAPKVGGALFAVMVQILLGITRVAVQVLFRAVNKSRYTKVYRKQVRGHDLSRFTKLSKYLNAKAKNVTNLLILLTVLCEVVIRFQ